MRRSTLAIYCFTDDFLKASGHQEGIRVEVSDSEVITIAITAMLQFGGNFEKSRLILHELGLMKRLLMILQTPPRSPAFKNKLA